MPTYSNLSCITDKVDITNPCTADQSAVEFFLDTWGISLADASKIADERHIQGQTLVDNKVNQALDDVYSHLTRNVNSDCDLDKADGILCDNSSAVARAVYYRTIALVLYELNVTTSRYNDYVHYSGDKALLQMVEFDSDFVIYTTLESVKGGKYQKELEKLEPIRNYIEQTCCGQCTGSGWSITIP